MTNALTPKKALLVEDEPDILFFWIKGLYEEGFRLGEKPPEKIVTELDEPRLVVLSCGSHQFHITRYANVAMGIVTGYRRPKDIVGATVTDTPYDACYMDRSLVYEDTTDNLIKLMVKENLVPEIYLISGDTAGQINAIGRGESFSTGELQNEGRLIKSNKYFEHNWGSLQKIFDFSTSRPAHQGALDLKPSP